MPSGVSDREFPIAKWVAALEASVRAGDFEDAAHAANELRRRGVRVSIPGLGSLQSDGNDAVGEPSDDSTDQR